jgi:hypothetical protein
VLALNHQNT